jgi:hypothetical protein
MVNWWLAFVIVITSRDYDMSPLFQTPVLVAPRKVSSYLRPLGIELPRCASAVRAWQLQQFCVGWHRHFLFTKQRFLFLL